MHLGYSPRPPVKCKICRKLIEKPMPRQKAHPGSCKTEWNRRLMAKYHERDKKAAAKAKDPVQIAKQERKRSAAKLDKKDRNRRATIKGAKPPRDRSYLKFLRGCRCAACKATPCDPAHVGTVRGLGQKCSDRQAIPLCRRCHDEQHRLQKRFWAMHSLDREKLILAFNAAFDEMEAAE